MSQILRARAWALAFALVTAATGVAEPAASAVIFRPPTDAPVLDPFRLPDGPYGAGNRGIEYDTADGDRVTAAAAGEVAFSGPVGGSLFVSIEHPGGLRSTYGYVAHLLVRVGTSVDAGDRVALAGGPFHFTVRLDGTYLDPATLFGVKSRYVTLVPHDRSDQLTTPPLSRAGLATAAATLLDGPSGPRMMPNRLRRIVLVRANPGRFGVLHELLTGKKERSWQSSP